jgi:hypothetical protein
MGKGRRGDARQGRRPGPPPRLVPLISSADQCGAAGAEPAASCSGGGAWRPSSRALARRRRVHAAHVRCPETVRPAGHPDLLTFRRSQLGCFLFSCGPSGPHTRQRGRRPHPAGWVRARALPRGSGACGWPEACHGGRAGTGAGARVAPRIGCLWLAGGLPRRTCRDAASMRALDTRAATPRPCGSRQVSGDGHPAGWVRARALPRGSGACGWPEACHGGRAGTPHPCGRSIPARRRRVLRLTPGVRRRSDPQVILTCSTPDARSWVVFCLHAARPGRIQDSAGDARILRAGSEHAEAPRRPIHNSHPQKKNRPSGGISAARALVRGGLERGRRSLSWTETHWSASGTVTTW